MSKFVFGMNQSLDGYIDQHPEFSISPSLFRHFVEKMRDLKGSVYGRRMYEIMRLISDNGFCRLASDRFAA